MEDLENIEKVDWEDKDPLFRKLKKNLVKGAAIYLACLAGVTFCLGKRSQRKCRRMRDLVDNEGLIKTRIDQEKERFILSEKFFQLKMEEETRGYKTIERFKRAGCRK